LRVAWWFDERLDRVTQAAMKQLAAALGAAYTGSFHRSANTHLVLNDPA
jgi:hypothetical protein